MLNFAKVLFISFFLLITLSSCSSKFLTKPKETPLPDTFSVKINHEYYDGKTLYVNCSKPLLAPEERALVLISLRGFSHGELLKEKLFNLNDLIEEEFTLALDIADLSDYQLEVLWGKPAWQTYRKMYASNFSQNLELISASANKIKRCTSRNVAPDKSEVNSIETYPEEVEKVENCQTLYKLKFKLKNNNQLTIPMAIVQFDLLDIFEQGHFSQKLELKSQNLEPGGINQFKFVIVEPQELAEFQLKPDISIVAEK